MRGFVFQTITSVWLTDMHHIFDTCKATQKQELVRTVFDNSLYYENKVYRTPYLIPEFGHNELIMREKNLRIWEKKGEILRFPRQVEVTRLQSNTLYLYYL
jgi:hypothetical protein